MPRIPIHRWKQRRTGSDEELERQRHVWERFTETKKEESIDAFLVAAKAILLSNPYESYGYRELSEAVILSADPEILPLGCQHHCSRIAFERKLLLDRRCGICCHTRILEQGGYEYRYYYNPKAVVER